jgi:RNA polymerase sigma-70 factor (ECF subfamily)
VRRADGYLRLASIAHETSSLYKQKRRHLAPFSMSAFAEETLAESTEFTELLQLNLLALNRFVFGMVGNHFEAEDIVQETVVKAFIYFADFRGESRFKTWLFSIALNEVGAKRRRDCCSRVSYFDCDQLERLASATSDHTPFLQYQESETTRRVQNAIVSLHPIYKEMIHLRAIDGLNFVDTARKLSISVPAAKARYYRAIDRLSHTLRGQTRKPFHRAGNVVQQV